MSKAYNKDIKNSVEAGSESKKKLSPREKEIYELLIRGKTNKDICEKLCVCRGTLENYITKIYRKRCVRNRIELINEHYGRGNKC